MRVTYTSKRILTEHYNNQTSASAITQITL